MSVQWRGSWGRVVPVLVGLSVVVGGCAEAEPDAQAETVRLVEVMRVEDGRPGPDQIGPLRDALADPDAAVRAVAVRALGRLENVAHLPLIEPLLSDDSPVVRAEAFNAVAQAAYGAADPEATTLLEGWAREIDRSADQRVRGALARSLGRLWLTETEDRVARARDVIGVVPDQSPIALEGALLGLYYLAQRTQGAALAAPDVMDWILARTDHAQARVRVLAAMTLSSAGGASLEVLDPLLQDAEPAVRRAAVGMLPPEAGERAVAALADGDYTVRVQALRTLGRGARDLACEQAAGALADESHHVRVSALQVLSTPCEDPGVVQALERLASGIGSAGARDWQGPTRALLALAAVAPDAAAPLLAGFVAHESPFVRAHAARAAELLGDESALRTLVADDHPNVRTAAITGLVALRGHDADDVLIAQLPSSDPQLVLTAAGLLQGSPQGSAVVRPALDALDHMSVGRRETFRDPRVELLLRVGEFGSVANRARVGVFLSDYDAVVAELAATILSGWSETTVQAHPKPTRSLPFPSAAEFDALASTRVILEMDFGGEITIVLAPHEAPTNAARFARLAEAGHFDGLTFHRVISNFIIQGGSPGANEFYGDGPYTRDELGMLSHWRGTVGLSTRGRDTGDSQIFVNTVDNLRLDHNYTIFGIVESGMDVVDATREGDVIRRARVERH
jgi:cyclophilin family peptidyl-prolyl cis-trans isomerase/HEAT repeat protein